MNKTFVSVISSIGENILKCTKFIEVFRLCIPDLPEEFLYVHSGDFSLDKILIKFYVKNMKYRWKNIRCTSVI